jgi:hypothetical protein
MAAMQTINDLFLYLFETSARFSKTVDLLDRSVQLQCSSLAFLEQLINNYTRTTLITRQIPPQTGGDICIIDSCTHCNQWRNLLPAQSIRTLDDPYVGHCKIYQVPDGLVLCQSDGWIVFRSAQDQLIFLLDGPLETDTPDQWPNPTGMISILLSELLARSHKWLVHAAGIGHKGCCHLLTGKSGSGKTTRTLAHVTKGFLFFGDDMVVLGKGMTGRWEVWPYWRPLHITRHTCELLPSVAIGDPPSSQSNKRSIEIHHLVTTTLPPNTPLEAIWILTATGGTSPRRLEHQESFALLSHTFMHGFWPETTQANLEALLDIVFQVPVFMVTRSTPLNQMVDELYRTEKLQ